MSEVAVTEFAPQIAGVVGIVFGVLAMLWAHRLRARDRRDFKVAVSKLDETAAELRKLEERYGRYRILDRLAGGDIAKSIVTLGGVPAHWMALGGAWLAAGEDPRLVEICERKAQWLAGEFRGSYDDWLAEATTALCFQGGTNRPLSLEERVVVAGAGSDGKAALAMVIKHLAEVYPDEEALERERSSAELASADDDGLDTAA